MKGLIVLAGSLAQKPYHGGHTWVFLQYLLGFKRLGWGVLFLDRLEPEMCTDATGVPCPVDASVNLAYLRETLAAFSLGDSFAVICDAGARTFGLPRAEILERVSASATLINVMGFLTDPEVLGAARHRVFFDIDPGFGQMWRELALHDPYDGYDAYMTVGERVGQPGCTVPDCGLRWLTTRQPVVLDEWRTAAPAAGGCFTSIGAWRGPYAPIEYRGRTYGLRAHEFRKFAALPALTDAVFEVALDIHAAEVDDLALLAQHGWQVVDPRVAAGNPHAYRTYIRASKAEIMVAKNMYVASQSGWFSDRSICYLASGRPVLAQDTGLRGLYPLGHGLLAFSSLDEAKSGVEHIAGHYEAHCRAARDLAEAYFDSDLVLSRLLAALGIA